MKIALVAPYPVQLILPKHLIKPSYQNRIPHPAPWVRILTESFSKRKDLSFRVFTQSRAVKRVVEIERNGICFTVIPQYEPARIGALHFHIPARLQFRFQINKYSPDLVHGFGTESIYGLIASEQTAPSVVFLQGILSELLPYMSKFSYIQKKILLYIEKQVITRTDHMIVETPFGADWVKSIKPDSNITIIPHAVNPIFKTNSPSFSKCKCLCIGTIYNVKGIDIAIRALAETSNTELSLSIIGTGPLLLEMKQLSKSLRVEDRVEFLGFLDDKQILSQMANARMLCILSRMDTSPNVLTEAHSAGLPVIGTRVGGIPDMISNGIDGFVVESEDFSSIASYMDKLASNIPLCRKMGLAGKNKTAKINNANSVTNSHLAVYKSLLDNTTVNT